jgi:hypothetical protein
MTRRQQLELLTLPPWPGRGLMPAVNELADDLADRGIGVPRVAVMTIVHTLYAVAASPEARDYARGRLLTWADMLDALELQAALMDSCRRCGPASVAIA